MPIRFRCSYCNRLLGIATHKAGTETICPHCGYSITVPVPQDDERTERLNLDDVDELMRNGGTEVMAPKAAVAAPKAAPVEEKPRADAPRPAPSPKPPPPKARAAPPPVPKPKPVVDPNDPPLFEGDVDELLGVTKPPEEPERPKPPAVSGLDALSLGEPARTIVLSGTTATLLMVLVAVLMVLSFAAGYFLKR